MWPINSKDRLLEGIGVGISGIFILIRVALGILGILPFTGADLLWVIAFIANLYAYMKRGHQLPVPAKKKKKNSKP